jgi:hypothetical protein
MRSSQEFIHWLEAGAGARWLRRGAVVAGVVALSLLIAWKQFHGPESEATLEQAGVGRQLAAGQGFSTLINYPQTAALLKARGEAFDPQRAYPELHHAPLYALAIAGGLRLFPAATRHALFAAPAQVADGFGGDYVLLAINLALLWAAAWLTYELGRRLFDERVGWVSALAVLVSLPFWQQTLAVNGTPLLMVLALAAFLIWRAVDEGATALDAAAAENRDDPRVSSGGATGRKLYSWLAALGAMCGLLFLTEYSAGTLVLVVFGYAIHRFRGAALVRALLAVAIGFAVVAGPWIARDVVVAGNPVALAAQNVALKAGDPTAEPASVRATLAAAGPALNLRKLGNKTLTALQESVRARLWSGGAMWFTALFVAGLLYGFRSGVANRMRWTFTAAFAALLLAQAALGSGESDRLVVTWLAPLIIVFGAGFFFILLGSNAVLGAWPRAMAAALLVAQALPLVHDALAPPPAIRFHYPPYFPALMRGMRAELELRRVSDRVGLMADVPAGVAWYAGARVWAQPPQLHDFYAITLEQPIGELLLTPRTLDRPFFTDLNAHAVVPGALSALPNRFGEWGEIYGGLLTGNLPGNFPLAVAHKVADNLYVLLNPTLPPPFRGK